MKIIADKNIPYLKGIAEKYGEVTYLDGASFTKEAIREADTLIVRTVTKFGKELLEGSSIKLICSATIGFDHIDTDYCDAHGIKWTNAPGCNSLSVQQYIISSLVILSQKRNIELSGKTIGIIGVGNVGKQVAVACQLLGMRVLLNDPPRQEAEPNMQFVDIETIKKESDFITFHVPLTKEGCHKTYHLADDVFFENLPKKPFIINAARGAIIDTSSIKKAIKHNLVAGAIIDCWEKEPTIDPEYMNMVDIATPHIAGYSADGKANATKMALSSLAQFWDMPTDPINLIQIPSIENSIIDYSTMAGENKLFSVFLKTYNPLEDMKRLLDNPEKFSQHRANYPLRREYPAYKVENLKEAKTNDLEVINKLGFSL